MRSRSRTSRDEHLRARARRQPLKSELTIEVEHFTQHLREPDPPWWLRACVRMHAHALDRRLADGANPLGSPRLALRARQLTDPQARRKLAIDIDVILIGEYEMARRPHLMRQPLPFDMAAVRTALDDLRALGDRLRDPRPVSERGVAMTIVLLRDGSGPLYDADAPLPLRYCVRMALLSLAA